MLLARFVMEITLNSSMKALKKGIGKRKNISATIVNANGTGRFGTHFCAPA
jgi:hypothetical protein